MSETTPLPAALRERVPSDRRVIVLDVASAPPPKPLTETLQRLATLEADELLVQVNDREPQGLYPKLEDRGARYASTDRDDEVVTAVWNP